MLNPINLIVLTSVFLIVLTCSHSGLSRAQIFTQPHRILLSIITAILAILGLIGMFQTPKHANGITPTPANPASWITALLIPYATLGIAIFLVALALFVLRFFKTKHGNQKTLHRSSDHSHRVKTTDYGVRSDE